MANGHNCHEQGKSLPNFRERQRDMQQSWALGPGPPSRPPGPNYLYSVPPLSSALPGIHIE